MIGTKTNHLDFNDVLDENNLIVVHKSCVEWSSGAKRGKVDGNDDKNEIFNKIQFLKSESWSSVNDKHKRFCPKIRF